MFNIFKKKEEDKKESQPEFEIELTASVLAYEIARSDGDISDSELDVLLKEVKNISSKVNKTEDEILKIIELHSKDSVRHWGPCKCPQPRPLGPDGPPAKGQQRRPV